MVLNFNTYCYLKIYRKNNIFCRYQLLSLFQNRNKSIQCLHDKASMGIETYISTKSIILSKISDSVIKFREKMHENSNINNNQMIFTEDIKLMAHIVEATDDLLLIEKMILKFNKQNLHLRFGNYVFGPVIMRMYYFLNKPEEALKSFKTKELDGFYDQLSSYLVLMDLLYENKMYHEIFEVYNIMREKQLIFGRHPRNILLLVFAACYKINSQESLNYVIKLWKEMNESGHFPLTRTVCFGAALALNQNNPGVSLEIISANENQNYILVKSIKALTYCVSGRFNDSFSILYSVLEIDKPQIPKQTFPFDVVNTVKMHIEKQNNKSLLFEFNRIENQLKEFNHLSDQSLEDMLCAEVTINTSVNKSKSVLDAALTDPTDKTKIKTYRMFRRPGLQEMI